MLSAEFCVVDRFYYSTICYEIGRSHSVSEIQSLEPTLWDWPKDLLSPDLTILLVLSEEERTKRLKKRNEDFTVNEEILEDPTTRAQILEAYTRIPLTNEIVDASGSPQEVLNAVLAVLTRKGLFA